jgi:hypothetical protein
VRFSKEQLNRIRHRHRVLPLRQSRPLIDGLGAAQVVTTVITSLGQLYGAILIAFILGRYHRRSI